MLNKNPLPSTNLHDTFGNPVSEGDSVYIINANTTAQLQLKDNQMRGVRGQIFYDLTNSENSFVHADALEEMLRRLPYLEELLARAEKFREVQRAHMKDRGNDKLGKLVEEAAQAFDDYLIKE